MSRKHPRLGTPRRAYVICRIGGHRWGADKSVGAGIIRRVCSVCRSVTIDLTGTHERAETLARTATSSEL